MKRYPKYEESGVEWLRGVPEHWVVSKIKFSLYFLTDYSANGSFASLAENVTYLDGKGYSRLVRLTDLRVDLKNEGIYVDEHAHAFLKKSELFGDEILIANVGAHAGFVCKMPMLDFKATLGPNMYILRFIKEVVENDFIYYTLISTETQEQLKLMSTSTAQPKLNKDNVKDVIITFPPLPEQQAIVWFLDHKIHLIDTLIDKKQQQIELLKELRTSTINQAVTKGLDPNVKMKDSGIEWLGEIPEHWDSKKIKYIFRIKKEISGKKGYDVLSVTQKGIKIKDITTGKGQLSMDYSKYQFVNVSDFVMNHMDLLTGYVDMSKYNGVTSPDYRVFFLIDEKSVNQYYLYLLQMAYKNKIFYGDGQGSSQLGRWRLPTTRFTNFKFPHPGYQEQRTIVEYLDEQIKKIDTIIENETKRIRLQKEYRTA